MDETNTKGKDSEKIMSIFDHLGELRQRLFKSIITILILFTIAYSFADKIIIFLKNPLIQALPEGSNALHFTGPLDVFMVNIKISFLAAIVFGCPIWLYQFWKFFEPALYPSERKYIIPFAFASSLLFFAGASFSFFLILPLALEFLLGMGFAAQTVAIITIKDYISLLSILVFGFGLVFETPLVLILLALLDIVNAKMLAQSRSAVAIGILVMGALLTPPDPMSQIMMALPLYIMFEISILIIRAIKK